MTPFTQVEAAAAPYAAANVDTDQIIPARFLKRPRDDRYASYLFHDLRQDAAGRPDPEFFLNQPRWREARILVADRNFGCGSSRESAVYALQAHGFRAVIAPSFGDIFFSNCFKNGFLPIRLSEEICASLRADLEAAGGNGADIAIDLEAQTVTGTDGAAHRFEIDGFRKHCLLNGLDDIGFTLELADDVRRFEQAREAALPWLPARGN